MVKKTYRPEVSEDGMDGRTGKTLKR